MSLQLSYRSAFFILLMQKIKIDKFIITERHHSIEIFDNNSSNSNSTKSSSNNSNYHSTP